MGGFDSRENCINILEVSMYENAENIVQHTKDYGGTIRGSSTCLLQAQENCE